MRRRPTKDEAPQPGRLPGLTAPQQPPNAPTRQPQTPRADQLRPQDAADRQEAWLRSGGFVYFPVYQDEAFLFDPRPSGYQLVSHYYVDQGHAAWLKQLRVAPFMPPVFAFDQAKDVVLGGSQQFAWPVQDSPASPVLQNYVRPSGHAGVWEAPFAWEAYTQLDLLAPVPIRWTWQLRMMPGDVLRGRAPFSFTDPATWFLAPDIPVPALVYPNGLPGTPPERYEPQRYQILQGDELTAHVFVPPDTTLCLWTFWEQEPVTPSFASWAGATLKDIYGPATYPLLPSFGQMSGYQQAADRPAAMRAALKGWQG
jgi:hypothetical protein